MNNTSSLNKQIRDSEYNINRWTQESTNPRYKPDHPRLKTQIQDEKVKLERFRKQLAQSPPQISITQAISKKVKPISSNNTEPKIQEVLNSQTTGINYLTDIDNKIRDSEYNINIWTKESTNPKYTPDHPRLKAQIQEEKIKLEGFRKQLAQSFSQINSDIRKASTITNVIPNNNSPKITEVYSVKPNSETSDRVEKAVKNLMAINETSINVDQLRKISEFIENYFSVTMNTGTCYLERKVTGLSCDVEYDPATKLQFIHTDDFIGKGGDKIATKSILYDVAHPSMLANSRVKTNHDVTGEIQIMKMLDSVSRTVHLIAAPSHMQNGNFVQEIITPLYSAGDLKDVSKKKSLSVREKVVLSMDLMEALKDTHALKISHGDIHDGNVLLEQNKNLDLKGIKTRLILMDMGKAISIKDNQDIGARKDIYAAGCTLFGILHNKGYTGSLYSMLNNFEKCVNAVNSNQNSLLLGELSQEMTKRKTEIERKNNPSSEEKFERIILNMLHPTYFDQRDSAYWYGELANLFQKI